MQKHALCTWPAVVRHRYITKTLLAMKLTILLLTVGFLHVHATGISQEITFSGKNVSLKKIFTAIESQTNYSIVYEGGLLKNTDPVSITAKKVPLEKFLETVLSNQLLDYYIENTTIVISKKRLTADQLEDAHWQAAFVDIGGVVKGVDGKPLANVSIVVKGSNRGTVTDENGKFRLDAKPGDVLVISSVGFGSKEIKVIEQRTDLVVALDMSSSPLDEVQIQAYGTTSRRLSTGNITTVKSDEIARQPIDNPLLALQGRVPGLIITPSSGLPGAPVTLQLRGQNSLMGLMTQPMIVIDGVPFANNIWGPNAATERDINFSALRLVDPMNIESIDVLKDADATAIYGSRGANGVILITTKKGKIGATRINVNAQTGITQNSNRKVQLLNTQQYLEMRKEAYINLQQPLPTVPSTRTYDLTVWDQNRYTDWQDVLNRGTGSFSSAQASVSGGNQAVQFDLGGNYQQQVSLFTSKKKDQVGSGHFSIIGNSADRKLRVSLSGSYTGNVSIAPDFSRQGLTFAPNAPSIYKEDGALNWEPNPLTGFATWQNPYASLSMITKSNSNVLRASFDISYELINGLLAKVAGGYSRLDLTSYRGYPFTSQDPANWTQYQAAAERSNNYNKSWSIEPQLNYKKQLSKVRLEVLVGASLQGQEATRQWLYAYGYTSDGQLNNLAGATGFNAYNGSSDYKYAGVFSRFNFNWGEKYIINLNGRRDGSSRFGPGNQFGNFGSAGIAWVFTNEAALQRALPFLSFGKLRGSYGTTGNDNIGDYQYMELYSSPYGSQGTYQDIRIVQSLGVVNPHFHWENTKKAEVGIELSLFKDRIILTSSFYRIRSNDQLGYLPLPSTAGAYSVVMNQPATIQNSGSELTLLSTIVKTKNFSWGITANISFNDNKLLNLPEGFTGLPNIYGNDSLGKPISPVGKRFAGVIPVYDLLGVDAETGYYIFATYDGKPSEPATTNGAYEFAKVINTSPDYFGGVGNTFQYKGLSLEVFFQFAKQQGRNPAFSYFESLFVGSFANGQGNISKEVFDNSWRKPGDNAKYMKFLASGVANDHRERALRSDEAWIDASFVRLKNVSLSYTIPDNWKQKMHIQSLRVYAQAQNLLTFSDYKEADPETQNIFGLAPLRVITFGFQVGL